MGRVLANALLKNCFHSGDHLLHSADGSYWAFNGRHWEPTSDAALGKLLMMEAAKSQPFCTNMQQLVGNALKTLGYMLGGDEDLMGFNAIPLPVVNCANGEVSARCRRQARVAEARSRREPADVVPSHCV